jgi:hypothetical protein
MKTKTMYDAFIAGWNVLPNYVGKDESEKLYSSRYILQGTDILLILKEIQSMTWNIRT